MLGMKRFLIPILLVFGLPLFSQLQPRLRIEPLDTPKQEGVPFNIKVVLDGDSENSNPLDITCSLYVISPGLSEPSRRLLSPCSLILSEGITEIKVSVLYSSDSVSIIADAGEALIDTSNSFEVKPGLTLPPIDIGNRFDQDEGISRVFESKDEELPYIFAYPNPMCDTTKIVFKRPESVSGETNTTILIYDAFGHLIWSKESYLSGFNKWEEWEEDDYFYLVWNGKREDDIKVANGVYNLIITFEGAGAQNALKMGLGVMR